MPKVDVLVFAYRAVEQNCAAAIQFMVEAARAKGVDVVQGIYGNALIHSSRNRAMAATRTDADFVLFVDDDMLPPPEALLQLLGHDLPVVSALCTTRFQPVRLALSVWSPERNLFAVVRTVALGKVVKGPLCPGAAFLLVKREVIDAVIEDHLWGADWMRRNRATMDRMKVRTEHREQERSRIEKARRALWASDRYARVFDYFVQDDERESGEDISFAKRLLDLGIETAVDAGLVVGHVGPKVWTVHDILDEERRQEEALKV